jgi:glucose/arabinose dehydrogenase
MFADRDRVGTLRAMRRLALILPLVLALAACGGSAADGARTAGSTPSVSTVATGLRVPWEIAFLPGGDSLITERPGRVRLLTAQRSLRTVTSIPGVVTGGENGLLGLALDPDFARNRLVYVFLTTRSGNVVRRYRYSGGRFAFQRTIVRGIRAAVNHDGGRLRFGPDRRLYISTGDATEPSLAQDRGALNGKLLRLGLEAARGGGGRPQIVSLGHRNPQGFDWQPGTGRLYEDEHGAAGNDEINLIRRGANYGWPLLQGGARRAGFTAPLTTYSPSIAPSGATFVRHAGSAWSGDYLVGALRGEQIRRLRFRGSSVLVNESLFAGRFGRIRTVVEGPGGALYALTNNTDGRGTPKPGDDRVLRIVPPAP